MKKDELIKKIIFLENLLYLSRGNEFSSSVLRKNNNIVEELSCNTIKFLKQYIKVLQKTIDNN